MIGVHSVEVQPVDAVEFVDVSCYVDRVAIHHGRDNVDSQPEASTTTIDLSWDNSDGSDLPVGFEVGAEIHVSTRIGALTIRRFTGKISDVVVGWDDAGEDTPNSPIGQVMAAGPLADIGRRVIGDVPWPQEIDGARVSRILALAGVILDPATSDPGTVQILARDVDAQPALGLAQEVANSANGLVWQTRRGEVRYADADHRRGVASSLALDACDILVTPSWRRDTQGLVNGVSIGYGVAEGEEGGEQPRYRAANADSRARYGFYDQSITTVLAALADAQAMANLLLTRNSSPVWLLSELPVDVYDLTVAETTALLSLDLHDLVGLTGLPVVGALPANTSLWVEGWTETLAAGEHEISLFVSGYCRTSPPPRWDDVDPGWTWDTVPADLSWDDLACLGPMPSRGRWNDVPASLRWDMVPAATTWDTWEG